MSATGSQEIVAALSVRQPWAWLIVHGFKDVENRTWRTNFRGRVLIHAGKTFGLSERLAAAQVAHEFGIDIPDTLPLGGIVGCVEIFDCVTQSDSRWFREDEFGWLLRNADEMPFTPLKGRQGFFNVAGDRSFQTREVLA